MLKHKPQAYHNFQFSILNSYFSTWLIQYLYFLLLKNAC